MKLLLLPLIFLAGVDPAPLRPGDHVRTLKIGKADRSYLVHIPKDYDSKKATPVVLALHGATMNAQMMQGFSGLSEKADEAGFIVVYPNGQFMTWNCGGIMNRSDDVGFIGKVLDDLATVANVDTKRVYAAG